MKSPTEHLFGSKTRIKLLPLFLFNPQREFYVRELTRKLSEHINSIRRELSSLSKIGLLVSRQRDKRKYYRVNTNYVLFKELKNLFLRILTFPQERLAREIKKIGKIKFACLSGFFTQSPSRCDFLLVGEAKHDRLEKLIKKLEEEQNHEINYTLMSEAEFGYRKDLEDRFVRTILENENIILVDQTSRVKRDNAKSKV